MESRNSLKSSQEVWHDDNTVHWQSKLHFCYCSFLHGWIDFSFCGKKCTFCQLCLRLCVHLLPEYRAPLAPGICQSAWPSCLHKMAWTETLFLPLSKAIELQECVYFATRVGCLLCIYGEILLFVFIIVNSSGALCSISERCCGTSKWSYLPLPHNLHRVDLLIVPVRTPLHLSHVLEL